MGAEDRPCVLCSSVNGPCFGEAGSQDQGAGEVSSADGRGMRGSWLVSSVPI